MSENTKEKSISVDSRDGSEVLPRLLEAFGKLNERVIQLEKLVLGHNELIAKLGAIISGQQQAIDSLASLADVTANPYKISPIGKLN